MHQDTASIFNISLDSGGAKWLFGGNYTLGSTTIPKHSNTLIVCLSLSGVPNWWDLRFWDSSIGSTVLGELNQAQLKKLKIFKIIFEPRSDSS